MTGAMWRFYNTGLLNEINGDPELGPEAAIEDFVDKSDPEMQGAKQLSRGHLVE